MVLTKILSLPFEVFITSSITTASPGILREGSAAPLCCCFSSSPSLPFPFSFALHPPAPVAKGGENPAAPDPLEIDPFEIPAVGEEGFEEEEGTRLRGTGEGLMCVWKEEEVARMGRWSNEDEVGEDIVSLFEKRRLI